MNCFRLASGLGLALLVSTPLVTSAGQPVTVELTSFLPVVHPSRLEIPLPWPPERTAYSYGFDWKADQRSFNFDQARVSFPVGTWELIAEFDRMPSLSSALDAAAWFSLHGPGVPVTYSQRGSTHLESVDLAAGLPLSPSRALTVTPWAGVSRIRTVEEEQLTTCFLNPTSAFDSATRFRTYRIDGRFLGVVAGAEARWEPTTNGWVSLRAITRWVGGRKTYQSETIVCVDPFATGPDQCTDEADHYESRNSRDGSRFFFAADVAFGLQATEHLAVAAGWLLRDYTDSGGPARVTGPFLRAVLTF